MNLGFKSWVSDRIIVVLFTKTESSTDHKFKREDKKKRIIGEKNKFKDNWFCPNVCSYRRERRNREGKKMKIQKT